MRELKKICLLLTLLMTFSFTKAIADNKFYLVNTDLEPGTETTLEFALDNDQPFYGFQAEITLPPDVEIMKTADGKLDISLSSRADASYMIVTNPQSADKLLIGTFSSAENQQPFSGTSGVLLSMRVKVGENFGNPENSSQLPTVTDLRIMDVRFVDATDKDVKLPASTTTLGVLPSKVELNATDIGIMPAKTYTLTATIYPSWTSLKNQNLDWTSTNSSLATVEDQFPEEGPSSGIEQSAIVSSIDLGEADIIVTASANGKEAKCTINIVPVPVESISLSNAELLMREGYSSDLIAIIHPDNATNKEVIWRSSDETIATVDQNGVVTAHKEGYCDIIAISEENSTIRAICKVTVEKAIIAVADINLSDYQLTLTVGDIYTLIATITPEDATDPTITWKSSDREIAIVSETGVVTALSPGKAIIYASTSNGLTEECAVTVVPKVIEVTGISLSNTELLMREGYTSDLIAIIRPDDATDKTVVWTTSNPEIATVDDKGTVTAIKMGFCTITATSANGNKAECAVTVVPVIIAVEKIELNRYSLDLKQAESFTLIATISPEEATDKSVTWRSSDRTVAIVSDDGVVTASGEGTAIIYASSSNGLTAECAVSVTKEEEVEVIATSISLSNTELLMREGYTADLIAIIHPDNAVDKSVTWTSSDESIATVDANGIVTAIKQGNAVITATAATGVSAICNVTVVPVIIEVATLTLNEHNLEMEIANTFTLIATITPDDASDKIITWKSSNSEVATVSDTGVVTAVSAGSAIIFASASNGLTDQCEVTVKPEDLGPVDVERISLSNTDLLMRKGYTSELIAIVRPDEVEDKSVTWKSADESIATVDQNGLVTAVEIGVTTITATSNYNPSVSADCKVTVEDEASIIAVSEIKISLLELTLIEGETFNLDATITPDNATDPTVTWKSADNAIATVDQDGIVTAVLAGKTVVYASSSNGLTVECVVTVLPAFVPVSDVSLTNTEITMYEGSTTDIIAIISPANATDQSVVWTSSDETIATVDQNGIITAIKAGNAIVAATCHNGLQALCSVTVIPLVKAVEGITVDPEELDLIQGDTYTLIATVTPEDATDKTVTWRTADRAIAIVNEDGVVTATGPGSTVIYASSSNGLTAECKVNVTAAEVEDIPVTGISLTNTELLMREGHTADLIAIIRPADATDPSVRWSSNDEEIAIVDQNGLVSAIKTGFCVITAASSNDMRAYCNVTVVPDITAVESITLNKSKLYLTEGENFSLIATIAPEDATDKSVTWRSSDRAVATVDQDGLVTAVKEGTTIIYASSSNGLTAECEVIVSPLTIEAVSITLDPTLLNMLRGETAKLTVTFDPENVSDKTLTWTSNNPDIASVDNGIVKAVSQGNVTVTARTSNGKTAYCIVNVEDRPATPRQLLRKGDGTTCTFVILMNMTDAELSELGYSYVVGYTDAAGDAKEIARTPLRYCHTTSEIFNDPTNDFWAYAVTTDESGRRLCSDLRHLDGREESYFDSPVALDSTKGEVESGFVIKVTSTALQISAPGKDDMVLDVYTPAGMRVFSKSYTGKTPVEDEIKLNRFAPGIYLVTLNCNGEETVKRIVVK